MIYHIQNKTRDKVILGILLWNVCYIYAYTYEHNQDCSCQTSVLLANTKQEWSKIILTGSAAVVDVIITK